MGTQFENSEILNASLLVDMVYIDERRLNQIRILEKKIIQKQQTKISKIANDFGLIQLSDLNSEYFIKDLVNYIWDELKNDLVESSEFKKIKEVRKDLYDKKELKKTELFSELDSEIDFKRAVLYYFVDKLNTKQENNIKIVPYGVTPYLSIASTSIDLENMNNKKLAEIRKEDKLLWEKFKPLKFSEELKNKYQNYGVKTANNLKADFENGYIDIGIEGLEKDTSFMVGYLKSEDDEEVLQVVFRGTENKAMSATKYGLSRYPNMERQYHRLEPILNDILEEEQKNNPKKKLKVMFSGHSLGAAVAEKALSKHQDKHNIEYKGILIANPGSFHYLQSVMNTLDEWHLKVGTHKVKSSKFKVLGYDAVKKAKEATLGLSIMSIMAVKVGITLGTGLASYSAGKVNLLFKPISKEDSITDKVINYSTLCTAKFISLGVSALVSTTGNILLQLGSPFVEKKKADPRSLTINHLYDPVPLAGKALFQNHNKQTVELVKNQRELGNSLAENIIIFHKTFNYYEELKELAKKGNIFKPKLNIENKESVIDQIRKMKDAVFGNKLQEVNFKPT